MTTAPLLSFDLDRTYPAPPERETRGDEQTTGRREDVVDGGRA